MGNIPRYQRHLEADNHVATFAALHLLWILIQEENFWLEAQAAAKAEEAQWVASVTRGGPSPPSSAWRDPHKRVSAKIVAVQHGTAPELWTKKNFGSPRAAEFGDEAQTRVEAPAPKAPAQVEATELQPAKPTYDPRVRQFREPPPVITSRYQWYIYPGEAV